MLFRVFFVAVSALVAVNALPTGAPLEACVTLEPQHGVLGQATASPYQLTAANNGDGTYQVTISKVDASDRDFKGTIIQARRSGTQEPFGVFQVTDPLFHTIDCLAAADTVTHSTNGTKASATFRWSPNELSVNGVRFYGTAVQIFDIYWIGLQSVDLGTLP